WTSSSATAGYYVSNYHFRSTQAVSDAATWKGSIPTSGNYQVYVRYTAGTNRAASAPYIIYHTGGSTTVGVNQQANGGTWVSVGTYNLAAGSTADRVKLSCWTTAGYVVIADAVKFVKQ